MDFTKGEEVAQSIRDELGWEVEHRGDLLIGWPVMRCSPNNEHSSANNFGYLSGWANEHNAELGGFSKDDNGGFFCLISKKR